MARTSPYEIELSESEERYLQAVSRKYTSPYCEVVRAKVVLLAAAGFGNNEIGERLDVPRQIVSKWRKRFFHEGLEALHDHPRKGRPPAFPPRVGGAGEGPGL
jgi:phosphoribosylformylglycinamidine (FGAM) synthase-like enzyme